MSISQDIGKRLQGIVGAEYCRPAVDDDLAARMKCSMTVSPGTEREIAEVLACANDAGLTVLPCGGGTKMAWGNPPRRSDVLLSTKRLNRVIDHAWADLTVAVEAGCTMKELQATLAKQGQRLALDCLWPSSATVGGVLSTNDSGVLRLRFGALRDLVIGVTIALPDGTLATSGGKVVKNVAGYDLPKLVTGALGTLGVITRAIFRTHPLCPDSLTLCFTAADIEVAQSKILAIQNSQLAHVALQIRCSQDAPPEVDILFEGRASGLHAQEQQLQEIVGTSGAQKSGRENWSAKEELWNGAHQGSAIAKLSVLPTMLASTLASLQKLGDTHRVKWKAVLQGTGIGWVRLDGHHAPLHAALTEVRARLESVGGSFTLLYWPANSGVFDSWGNTGDSLPLMRAIKNQFDPKCTLNPGRFVGGI